MANINKVILIGRLGRDPELRKTTAGGAVVNFSLATSETWKDKTTGEKQERTEWHRVVVWGRLAEICAEYLTKGSAAYVEGKLRTSTYERDGVKHSKTEVIADEVKFLGGRGDSQPADATPKGDDDDIPF